MEEATGPISNSSGNQDCVGHFGTTSSTVFLSSLRASGQRWASVTIPSMDWPGSRKIDCSCSLMMQRGPFPTIWILSLSCGWGCSLSILFRPLPLGSTALRPSAKLVQKRVTSVRVEAVICEAVPSDKPLRPLSSAPYESVSGGSAFRTLKLISEFMTACKWCGKVLIAFNHSAGDSTELSNSPVRTSLCPSFDEGLNGCFCMRATQAHHTHHVVVQDLFKSRTGEKFEALSAWNAQGYAFWSNPLFSVKTWLFLIIFSFTLMFTWCCSFSSSWKVYSLQNCVSLNFLYTVFWVHTH